MKYSSPAVSRAKLPMHRKGPPISLVCSVLAPAVASPSIGLTLSCSEKTLPCTQSA